jgi:coproporphyrinogen III oxidase-like Fe-S oxidoreductase
MWKGDQLRNILRYLLTRSKDFVLEKRIPALLEKLQDIHEFGLYLHIPFCRQICLYCPYNKVIYQQELAERYAQSLLREIDLYTQLVGNRAVTSFYIGGGTPTTMLRNGLSRILDHIYRSFNMQCDIHMESHPNDLSEEHLSLIRSMGVKHLSIGVEALQDHHLRTLQRPYSAAEVQQAVRRAVGKGFTCVNADFIFALPNQTCAEIEEGARLLVDLGVDQIAAYPLFRFPYTGWDELAKRRKYGKVGLLKRRKMLAVLERVFYAAGYRRTSVWAFTKRDVPKYCSVTVPLYLGLGASAGSYLMDVLYFNTFNVGEYIRAVDAGRFPIALSIELTKVMQMAGWLYWRIYETEFMPHEFRNRFGEEFGTVYGVYMKLFSMLGMLKEDGEKIVLSDRGAYWLHVVQDFFSIQYISYLWGTSRDDPWPSKVVL